MSTTAANLRFALAVDPANSAALRYRDGIERMRAADAPGVITPTLPSLLSLEIQVNPFLRCDDATVRAAAESHAGEPLAEPSEVFRVLRAWKDGFR